jgi:hypothetical protein
MEKSITSQICNDVPEPFWQIKDSVSSRFLVNPELRHSSYQLPSIGIPGYPSSYQLPSIGIPGYPFVYDTSKFETDEEMNQKFIKFLYYDRVRIRAS